MVVTLNVDAVKRGVIIGFATNVGHESCRFSTVRNLNRSLGLPIVNIRIVGTPQIMFTNLIMTFMLGHR
jgi:hypothetical protein